MECCPEHESISDEMMAKFKRHFILTEILDESIKLRTGKFIIGGDDVPARASLPQEPSSELLELPQGRMVWARRKDAAFGASMAADTLAKCLRATFTQLGIQGDVVEVGQGVWLSDTALDNLEQWAARQPLNEDCDYKSTNSYDDSHFSSGPRKFAHTFNRIAQAQAISR